MSPRGGWWTLEALKLPETPNFWESVESLILWTSLDIFGFGDGTDGKETDWGNFDQFQSPPVGTEALSARGPIR